MIVTSDAAGLGQLHQGNHVCWVVPDGAAYAAVARRLLHDGAAAGQKTVVFAPTGSTVLTELGPSAGISGDPRVEFLGEGPLEPELMFAAFRMHSARARAEGYDGLCIVADMDWLLPTQPSTEDIVGFELRLDALARELGATIVCAYRRASFDTAAIEGALAVHPQGWGAAEAPQFRFVAGDGGEWRLVGEIDVAVAATFGTALVAATSRGACTVDVAGLDFIDIAGMRAIAEAARARRDVVRLHGASLMLRRAWELARFDQLAPTVELVA